MVTDTSEKGLESLIVAKLTGNRSEGGQTGIVADPAESYGGSGYVQGDPKDYDRDHAVDLAKLLAFLQITQPDVFDSFLRFPSLLTSVCNA